MKPSTIIRLSLTLLLMYGVSTEVGIWTTISIFLIFIHAEATSYNLNLVNQSIKETLKWISNYEKLKV